MAMNIIRILLLVFVVSSGLFSREINVVDSSQAGADGPYVFYRDGKIYVNYVVMRDVGAKAVTQIYTDRQAAQLTCFIPETKEKFSFLLRDQLSVPASVYPASKRMLVLSDIEGNFEAMKMMLLTAGVMDKQFRWTFGDGDLVLHGDFFDRGLNVTECLWLLYKLDGEAEAAGGRLHFILGNHEIMNLQGNYNYVRNKYIENAKLLHLNYPDLYNQNTELGRWLRTKNSIEKIGDVVFCHGGISPKLAQSGLSLAEINKIARKHLGVNEQEIKSPAARLIFDRNNGVFWFRGLAKTQTTVEDVDMIMEYLGAKRIILGHTLKKDLTAYYDGRVVCIDLYHELNLQNGFAKALLIEGDHFFGLDSSGSRSSIYSER